MAVLDVFAERLDRTTAPEALGPGRALALEHMDAHSRPGSVQRGRGRVRPDFATAETDAVLGAGIFRQRNGQVLLVWCTAGGAIRAQVAPSPAYTEADF